MAASAWEEGGSTTVPRAPVAGRDATVLIEPARGLSLDGVAYVRQGRSEHYPLLTVRPMGAGMVVRRYAQNRARRSWAHRDTLVANLLRLAAAEGEAQLRLRPRLGFDALEQEDHGRSRRCTSRPCARLEPAKLPPRANVTT